MPTELCCSSQSTTTLQSLTIVLDLTMSASPSGLSNGRTPTPNGGPPQFIRKAKPADPLRPRKKPLRRPNLPSGTTKSISKEDTGPKPVRRPSPARQLPPPPQALAPRAFVDRRANGGWTNPPPPSGQYQDFPLFTTKRALREGLRYHVARFQAKKDIDPTNQDVFTRPISLHRRDPRQPVGKGVKDEDPVDIPVDSKEREKKEIAQAEAEARKAANQAQIAPTGNNAAAATAKKFSAYRNEKTTQVYRLDKTEAQKRESDLRYEEALPWHLEDADNKNTWVGNYEAALSDTNVVFVIEGAKFKMIPIEKWYKFSAKNQFKGFTIEEAEARFDKKVKESRWVMKTQEKEEAGRAAAETRKQLGNLYMVKAESNTFKSAGKTETQDADDLDFNDDDLFQDDDEMATVEPDKDEDAKESKERIKREQLGANIFGQTNEADVDQELEEEEREAERRRKLGKDVKKALTKREKMTIYESDSSNPYASSVCLIHLFALLCFC
jgi:transcription initiation factor TFIIF subunit alpha